MDELEALMQAAHEKAQFKHPAHDAGALLQEAMFSIYGKNWRNVNFDSLPEHQRNKILSVAQDLKTQTVTEIHLIDTGDDFVL